VKGWFRDTIPLNTIEKISILRLDGDMYESTIDVLDYLYPKLSIGGFCIIDALFMVLTRLFCVTMLDEDIIYYSNI
jgi:hypothetical protein